jgi:hypothetical protein
MLTPSDPEPDPLTRAEDLPGARQVEGMDTTGDDAAERRCPAPAASAPTSRPQQTQWAERLPPSGRNPGHAVGVEEPDRLEGNRSHDFSHPRGARERYGTS